MRQKFEPKQTEIEKLCPNKGNIQKNIYKSVGTLVRLWRVDTYMSFCVFACFVCVYCVFVCSMGLQFVCANSDKIDAFEVCICFAQHGDMHTQASTWWHAYTSIKMCIQYSCASPSAQTKRRRRKIETLWSTTQTQYDLHTEISSGL